ncbi:NAD(P)H-hydrate dehydratase [bacterium]|nr:NAD(P)H-hydrate dehydratase [bacterium]
MKEALIPTAQEMAALDAFFMDQSGIRSLELMDRVGREIARRLDTYGIFTQLPPEFGRRTVVLVGPGNNGGDGLVLARCLREAHRVPVAVILTQSSGLSSDCQKMLSAYLSIGGECYVLDDNTNGNIRRIGRHRDYIASERPLRALFSRAAVIVDALLGTGQSGAPRGNIKNILGFVKDYRAHTPEQKTLYLSIDVPTGISGDSGEVFESAFKADITLTVQHLKLGMTQGSAPLHCGEILLIDGGIKVPEWRSQFVTVDSDVCNALPPRTGASHKGTFGHVLIIGGCEAMPGAGILASQGAFATGAGKVSQLRYSSTMGVPPEVMQIPVSSEVFTPSALSTLISRIEAGEFESVVIGPGLGTSDQTRDAVMSLLTTLHDRQIPCVLDADGLNIISATRAAQSNHLLRGMVLTPHLKEAARLLNVSTEAVQRDRVGSVQRLHDAFGATILLKGGGSLVWNGVEGRVNTVSAPFLATAGSGDVLSGVIGGLLAQRLSLLDAASFGMLLHGLAAKELGERPFGSSELAGEISRVLARMI